MKITHKLALGLGLALLAQGAQAQDRMKVAIGQRGVYENSISELGQDKGFFKKHGLVLELLLASCQKPVLTKRLRNNDAESFYDPRYTPNAHHHHQQ